MLKSVASVVPIVLALGLLYLAFFSLEGSTRGRMGERVEGAQSAAALNTTARVAVLAVTLGGMLSLLTKSMRGGPVPAGELAAPALCVLGGVLLTEAHWAVALAFAAVAVGPALVRPARAAESPASPAAVPLSGE